MDAFTLMALGILGAISIIFFTLKGVLDQIPGVLHSARRVQDAWRQLRSRPRDQAGGEPVDLPDIGPTRTSDRE
ncbi:hypothetical protein [Streptomyces millisiae]|uniref:Uncharacterized protein n=1 Tax=Streptomyces millisiae TaxID=3075542 RepID=A0ABU2LJG9_9ACTN|nr:hypothetical protein [Streptomyces sp. DSM 44918]MDT0317723.1 hypothetical protein [Streptomyces sp. DSM 44918]